MFKIKRELNNFYVIWEILHNMRLLLKQIKNV